MNTVHKLLCCFIENAVSCQLFRICDLYIHFARTLGINCHQLWKVYNADLQFTACLKVITGHWGINMGPDNMHSWRWVSSGSRVQPSANSPSTRCIWKWPWLSDVKDSAASRLRSSSKCADDIETWWCDVGQRAATTRTSVITQWGLQVQIGRHIIIIIQAWQPLICNMVEF